VAHDTVVTDTPTYHITDPDPAAPLGPRPDSVGLKTRAWKAITDQWRPPATAPTPDDPRHRNQQRIDALRDQVTDRREDTAEELAHDREQTADEDHRYDDDEFGEDSDLHSGLGY